MVIVPAVFALRSADAIQLINESGPASTGLTFVWIPELFQKIPGGRIFLIFFFLALASAALTSLVAMMEMAAKNLIDFGMTRKRALIIVCSGAFIFGLPSLFSLKVLANQDWVWGIGLLISGFFMAIAAVKHNLRRFRELYIRISGFSEIFLRIFDAWIRWGIPVLFSLVIAWWFTQAVFVFERAAWWHPFRIYSIGTCLFQWGLFLLIFILFNKNISALLVKNPFSAGEKQQYE